MKNNSSLPSIKSGTKLTDEQIRKMMLEDPEASKFLDGILPGEQQFSTVVVNQIREK